MLKRIRDYVENEPWERHLEEDKAIVLTFCWVAILFSVVWFGGAILQVLIQGPAQ